YNPANGTDSLFVRDPRLNWIDTASYSQYPRYLRLLMVYMQMSTGTDGYLYFTNNQLAFGPLVWPGTDRRQRPFALFRVKLPNNATKPLLV
ncbi:hypothetical protein KCU66_g4360, partial [Aureobasidium melanogenum]